MYITRDKTMLTICTEPKRISFLWWLQFHTQQNILVFTSIIYLLYEINISICLVYGVTAFILLFNYYKRCIDLDLGLRPKNLTYDNYHKHFRFGRILGCFNLLMEMMLRIWKWKNVLKWRFFADSLLFKTISRALYM